jgi:hypothetical protein
MENQPQQTAPVLEIAWRKFGQFDIVAGKRSKAYIRLRKQIAFLGVL